jgi:hypothetical protein
MVSFAVSRRCCAGVFVIAKRKSHVVARQVDDEAVLVPIRNDVSAPLAIHALGPVAAFVWGLLDGTHAMDVIADMVSDEFDVDTATARADVRTFLGELQAAGLVEVS